MKITVNLDTQAVITQPSPLRFKGGCFNPVEIAFTRSSISVSLPSEAVIELSIKPKNLDGDLLAYLNLFTPAAGNLYTGSLNCATAALLAALEVSLVEACAEVAWSFGGQKFRSITFAGVVEPPVTDDEVVATPDPELYPKPAEVARKSDIPQIAGFSDVIAGNRADVTMSPLGITQWFDAKLPGTSANALLGDGSWGLPDLSAYSGSLAGDGTNISNVSGVRLQTISGANFNASGAMWIANCEIQAPFFTGDGRGLNNIELAQKAHEDGNGVNIVLNYALQSAYYGSLSVGNADWANTSSYAYNSGWSDNAGRADSVYYADVAGWASSDYFGCPLYGAGNIPSYFFGDYPNAGDILTYDGGKWASTPGNPLPATVENAAGRFVMSNLKTGWLVKQLDARTVYQVLDPNDCGTELGWVPVGPFILIPSNSTPLVIDNTTPALGDTVHCTAGTWSDNPTSYGYRWYRNGLLISGANSLAYTIVAADDGGRLQCTVSATNAAGTAYSQASIPVVVLNPPTNTAIPTITPAATPNVGDTLSLTVGGWTGFGFTMSYQWNRAGTAISGATAETYVPVVADAGQTITCTVTRTNIRGNVAVTTAATPAVTNLISVNAVAPTLNITAPSAGMVLRCLPGTWTRHPTGYNYQWRRGGVAISGATDSLYAVSATDVGNKLSCAVAAVNGAGAATAITTAESSAVVAGTASPIQGTIASGLIARWSLDEAAGLRYDVSGNGIDLIHYTDGGNITSAAGKYGVAASVPVRSYFKVTDSRLADVKTICGWFKLLAANNSYQRLIGEWIQVYSGSPGVAWDKTHYSTGVVPTPSQWFFVCATFTGTTFKLWVNNQSFTVQTVSAGTPFIGTTLQIADPNYESVTMLVDEVACWNRVLTDAEITTLATT